MSISVRYLPETEIEQDANALLREFVETTGEPVSAPVPVDDITTYHLALRLGFADLHETLDVPKLRNEPDIFGAIWFDKEIVLIDRSLDPEKDFRRLGRYRFSIGHEVGHWRLHRNYFIKDPAQHSLFGDDGPPSVVCRSSDAKARLEWQADYYASCLLMPRALILSAWKEQFGNTNARAVYPKNRIDIPEDENDRCAEMLRDAFKHREDELLEAYVRPFAQRFEVSPIAMRIRLEKMGLLHRKAPMQQALAIG